MNMKAIDNSKTTISLSEISSPSHLIDFVMKTFFSRTLKITYFCSTLEKVIDWLLFPVRTTNIIALMQMTFRSVQHVTLCGDALY